MATLVATASGAAAGAVRSVPRWTFPRVLLLAAAAQPVVHVLLGHRDRAGGGGGAAGHAAHASHANHGSGAATAGAATSATMVAAHLLVALAVAVALRWGARWLRALPAPARAFVLARPGVRVAVLAPAGRAPAEPARRLHPSLLAIWASRGPPLRS